MNSDTNMNRNLPDDLSSLKEIVESLGMNEVWSEMDFGLEVTGDVLKRVAQEVSLQNEMPVDEVCLAIK